MIYTKWNNHNTVKYSQYEVALLYVHGTFVPKNLTIAHFTALHFKISPQGFRILRLPEFIDSTWRWQGCQPCAPAPFYLQSLFCSWMRLNLPRYFQHAEPTLFGTGKCTQCHFQQRYSLNVWCGISGNTHFIGMFNHCVLQYKFLWSHYACCSTWTWLHHNGEPPRSGRKAEAFWMRIIKKDWYGELEWWLGLRSHLSSIHQISSCRVAWLGLHNHLSSVHQISSCRVAWGQECNIVVNQKHNISRGHKCSCCLYQEWSELHAVAHLAACT
jgi:hypothetical protein